MGGRTGTHPSHLPALPFAGALPRCLDASSGIPYGGTKEALWGCRVFFPSPSDEGVHTCLSCGVYLRARKALRTGPVV